MKRHSIKKRSWRPILSDTIHPAQVMSSDEWQRAGRVLRISRSSNLLDPLLEPPAFNVADGENVPRGAIQGTFRAVEVNPLAQVTSSRWFVAELNLVCFNSPHCVLPVVVYLACIHDFFHDVFGLSRSVHCDLRPFGITVGIDLNFSVLWHVLVYPEPSSAAGIRIAIIWSALVEVNDFDLNAGDSVGLGGSQSCSVAGIRSMPTRNLWHGEVGDGAYHNDGDQGLGSHGDALLGLVSLVLRMRCLELEEVGRA